jgi:hypothetical protein
MKIVTINPSQDFTSSIDNLPGELCLYTDKHLEHIQPLAKFLGKYGNYTAPSWQYDISQAARRIYAFIEAARGHKGLTVFIDPRFHVKHRMVEDTFRKELGRNYLGLFKRDGMPSKTDLYMVDGAYPEHEEFLEYLASILETETFKNLTYWTDGSLLDEAARRLPQLPVKNLSGVFGKEKEPLRLTALGEFLYA